MAPVLRRLRLLGVVTAVLLLASACGDAFRSPAAVVHGSEISDAELRENIPLFRFLVSLQQSPCGSPQEGERQSSACSRFVLGQLIEGELVGSYARSHALSVSRTEAINAIIPLEQQMGGHAALVKQLSDQGLTFGDLLALAVRLLVIQKVAEAVGAETVTTGELRQRYQQERLQFTELHVAHILLHNHRAAVKIAAQATARNFADLARRYSKDPGSGPRGGDLGFNRAAALDPTFVQAALQLSPGQISGPVHTQFGWHVIRLLSVRVIPFRRARRRLIGEVAGQAFTTWLRQQAASGIDVNPRYGRFDPSSGQVLPIRCTSATPSADCATTPSPTPTP